MAAQLKKGGHAPRRRVFVLVDKGEAQGVFSSWDAAEAYADENRFSLDHLYEFETSPDHPDHLHLMAAQWGGEWKFVGEWSKKTPTWKEAPERIRLDHYHALGNKFHLFREKDFKWREGVLELINPMAPDAAMKIDFQIKSVPAPQPKPQWIPKLTPLKPIGKADPPESPAEPEGKEPQDSPAEPDQAAPSKAVDRPALMDEPEPPLIAEPEPPEEAPPPPKLEEKPKITFASRNSLRLRTDRPAPQPIPNFQNQPAPPPGPPSTTAGLPQAGKDIPAVAEDDRPAPEQAIPGKVRRVWPMRLIIPVLSIFVFWAGGLYWALKPPATTQSIVRDVSSLANARILAIEPGQVFFQLEVDPVHQQRWVRSLGLLPIPYGKTFTLPQYHALDTWEKPDGFIRPPYAEVEVREWWKLRLRRISYGFYYEWEDGTLLIMDLQGDLLLGWGRARHLPELMN